MLRTKMYWFKTTPNDVNTYIYIGQQLKRRRTCPIGWRGHVFRWHVHTFWLPKLWNRQIPGETCYGSAVSTAESGSAPGHRESAMFFPHRSWQLLNITPHLQRNSLPQHSVGLCRQPGVGCKTFPWDIPHFDSLQLSKNGGSSSKKHFRKHWKNVSFLHMSSCGFSPTEARKQQF